MTVMTLFEKARELPDMLIRGSFDFNFDGMPLYARKLSSAQRWNLLLNGLNGILGKNINFGLPPIIQVEPSSMCNLSCPLCPVGSNSLPRSKMNMSLQTFEKVLSELAGSLVAVYFFSFGEPFMNKDLTRMIKACTERNILTLTSTNGHFIQSIDEAMEVVRAGLSSLIIAVDGSTQEIYQQYRKGGSLEKVKRCIMFIEEAKRTLNSPYPYTNMRTVVSKYNQHDLENLERLAKDLGVNMFSYKSMGLLTNKAEFNEYEPTAAELKRFEYDDAQRKQTRPYQCIFPFRHPFIFSDGTVVGCEYDHNLELSFGRIGEKPFAEIWNSANSYQLRKSIRDMVNRPAFCRNCPYEGRVQSGCELQCHELKAIHS